MKLGADRKKVVILGGLGLVLVYFLYSNLSSDTPVDQPQPRSTAAKTINTPGAIMPPDISRPAPIKSGRLVSDSREFRPSLKRKPEDAVDPMQADPTLRLDLLAKVQDVQIEGGERNLFQFGQPPAPKITTPDVKIPVGKPNPAGPLVAANGKPADPPAPPPPPPIPLKFYGFTSQARRQTDKRAFFLNGDEIIVAGEGEVIDKKYKVLRIGVNSAVLQDIEHKREQTLALEEQPG